MPGFGAIGAFRGQHLAQLCMRIAGKSHEELSPRGATDCAREYLRQPGFTFNGSSLGPLLAAIGRQLRMLVTMGSVTQPWVSKENGYEL